MSFSKFPLLPLNQLQEAKFHVPFILNVPALLRAAELVYEPLWLLGLILTLKSLIPQGRQMTPLKMKIRPQ